MSRILVHFSCGAASAIAAKITVERYGHEADVEVINCDLSADEHPDNLRFLDDVERWIGRPIKRLAHHKYKTIDDVFLGERFIVGPHGAACTRVLKREVGDAYSRPDDRHVLGYTADEASRIAAFVERNPDKQCLWVLAAGGITKEDCYHVLSANGIELPVMYRLGYDHNNCIGCVKGGKGYWNKVRRDFPEVFARRAAIQRAVGAGFSSGGELFFLDELDPNDGRDVPEPAIECGVFCSEYTSLVQAAVNSLNQSTPTPATCGKKESTMTTATIESPSAPPSSSLEDFNAGKPGVYEGIPAEAYHRLRAISSTVLKRVWCDTPKHAKAALDNPDLVGSDELVIGAAAHAVLLTPDEFETGYTCSDTCVETVKATGKRCEHDGKILNDGRWYCGVHGKGKGQQASGTVLTTDNYRRVRGIHDAVWANAAARHLLERATERELSVLWTEEDPQGTTSILCKARFDVLCRNIGVLPDLKTCRSADPDRFVDDAWNRGYHLQLAHYLRGGIVAGVAADLPTVIAVENEEPFDVVVFVPSRRLMERGVEARTTSMAVLLECERSGMWPGHSAKPVTLDLPKWVK